MNATGATADRRVAVVTGATSGIGRLAARKLGARGWTVVVTGRDRERGVAALDEVVAAGGGADSAFVRADFADLDHVRGVAREVRERYDRLDVLVNNAACSVPDRRLALDGRVERTLAVNHLAPYLLTHELLDRLVATPPTRVVVTASDVHRRGRLRLDDLRLEEGYDGLDAYARSKLANVLFARELAHRVVRGPIDGRPHRGTPPVTVTAYHPGFVPGTGLYRDAGWFGVVAGVAARVPRVGTSVEAGASGLVSLTTGEAGAPTGAYVTGETVTAADPRAGDAARRRWLWNVSADLVGVAPDWGWVGATRSRAGRRLK